MRFPERFSRDSDDIFAIATLQIVILCMGGSVFLNYMFDEHLETAIKVLQGQLRMEPNGCFDEEAKRALCLKTGLDIDALYVVVWDQLEERPDGTFGLRSREALRQVSGLNVGVLDDSLFQTEAAVSN